MPVLRNLLMSLLALAPLAGCQSSNVLVTISPDQAKQVNLHPTGGIAANDDGQLYLTTASNLVRYDPDNHSLTDLLLQPASDLGDVALTKDGVALVARAGQLDAYLSGYLVKVIDLPATAQAVSCGRDSAYIQTRHTAGTTRLLRYGLISHQLDTLAIMDHPLDAICAVPGGCLVAAGGNVFKVTDPAPDTHQTIVAMLFAIQGPVVSLAADPNEKIVYVSDPDMTYVWTQGTILPFFPSGGRLAWNNDTLTICQTGTGQIVQIQAAAARVAGLLKGLTASK